MSASRDAKYFIARQVLQDIRSADLFLIRAQQGTDDVVIAEAVARARKELSPVLRRAESVLKHADLVSAPQPELGLTPESPTREKDQ